MNILIQQLNEQYNEAQVKATGKFAVRNGHYSIKAASSRTLKSGAQVPTFLVNWKPASASYFLEDATFEVAQQSFKPQNSTEAQVDYASLINKTILVYDAGLSYQQHLGIQKARFVCKWAELHMQPQFKNSQDMLVESIFGNARYALEAAQAFAATAPYNTSEYEEWEAIPADLFETVNHYVEDDAPDAPEGEHPDSTSN